MSVPSPPHPLVLGVCRGVEMQVEDLFLELKRSSLSGPRVHDTGLTLNQRKIRLCLKGDSDGAEELDRAWKIN